jgi:hypothetical protein
LTDHGGDNGFRDQVRAEARGLVTARLVARAQDIAARATGPP